MKIGMNLLLWTDHPTEDHAALLERIKQWGFDGVEFPVLAMSASDVAALARRCDELELDRTALVAYGSELADPVHPDEALRKAASKILRESIEKTRDLGAKVLVGPFQQGLGRFTGAGPTQEEWNRSRDVIREAADHGARMHVSLAVEPLNRFEMFLFNTIAEGARFCEDVGASNVGLLADTHHSNIEEDRPGEEWAKAARHILHVHISENNRGVPGRGHAVTTDIFRALRHAEYDGWLTIEAFGLKVPGLIPGLHLWRSFFEKEEDVATQGIAHIRRLLERTA